MVVLWMVVPYGFLWYLKKKAYIHLLAEKRVSGWKPQPLVIFSIGNLEWPQLKIILLYLKKKRNTCWWFCTISFGYRLLAIQTFVYQGMLNTHLLNISAQRLYFKTSTSTTGIAVRADHYGISQIKCCAHAPPMELLSIINMFVKSCLQHWLSQWIGF